MKPSKTIPALLVILVPVLIYAAKPTPTEPPADTTKKPAAAASATIKLTSIMDIVVVNFMEGSSSGVTEERELVARRLRLTTPRESYKTLFGSLFLKLSVALALLAATLHMSATEEASRARDIEALVEEKINRDGPGVAILVSRNGVPLLTSGYGLADMKAGTPITPDSLFDLASVSKQMTGVAILTLVEKGKLKLERPVADYINDFKVPVNGRPITVNDLLHRST